MITHYVLLDQKDKILYHGDCELELAQDSKGLKIVIRIELPVKEEKVHIKTVEILLGNRVWTEVADLAMSPGDIFTFTLDMHLNETA